MANQFSDVSTSPPQLAPLWPSVNDLDSPLAKQRTRHGYEAIERAFHWLDPKIRDAALAGKLTATDLPMLIPPTGPFSERFPCTRDFLRPLTLPNHSAPSRFRGDLDPCQWYRVWDDLLVHHHVPTDRAVDPSSGAVRSSMRKQKGRKRGLVVGNSPY